MHHSNFVHLHLHTQWSLLDGAIRPEALIKLCHESYKMPAVAMTDHGNIFGAVDFYSRAMKRGIKPIIGCETYVATGSRLDKTSGVRGSSEAAFHLVLLVKNAKGYHNLCKLLTKAYLEGFYYRPRIDKGLLKELNEGLIAMSACLHGEIAHLLGAGQKDAAMRSAAGYKEIFKDRRFYLELQKNGLEEQERVNAGLIEISRALDIPLVATNDCHYLEKKDSRVHDVLLCIQTGKTVNAADRMRFSTDQLYVKPPEEMTEAFRDVPEAISNTIEIAERCNLELKLGENHLPDFPVPAGETLDTLFETTVKAGLERRLAGLAKTGVDVEAVRLHYYDRLFKEIGVIKRMGFPGYFLIVEDFIRHARSKDIPVGPGRGSAAGSLVAWSLGITNLDPIKYNLLFERFLNPDRISLPDIDIDFCYEKRDEVIKYVTQKYGSDNVTQIITFGQMKARACIRDVGRALDMPYGDVDRIAKLVPEELDITIESALEKEPRLKKLAEDDEKVKDLIEVAIALEGLPRHASTHAAGVVISNRPLVEYVPLYKSQKEDVITTQFAMKDIEKIGLVKFDFLGLKTLTVIDKTVKAVKRTRGVAIDMDALPLDDKASYDLIASGDTNGIFQLESSGIKEKIKKLRPENFEEVMAAIALYRPGPLQSGMVEDFINRKHGKTPIAYELPELQPILENTYGVMVYQEQVMEIARVLAGFTPAEADALRKAMGKKLSDVMLAQKTRFLDGAKKKNVPLKKAEHIFDLIVKFAGYGFNKSHSAVYALIAYQTAYLKVHYPAEFMAALMSSDMGDTDKVVKYVNECRAIAIPVDPPDINSSFMEFYVTGGRVRFGLGAIKNVGGAAIEETLNVRSSGAFASMIDFLSRVDSRKLNKKVTESLIKCGAFDFAGEGRLALLASMEEASSMADAIQRDREQGQKSIFDMLGGQSSGVALKPRPALRTDAQAPPPLDEKDLLRFEKETLGFYFSSHPLSGYKKELEAYATASIGELRELADASEATVAGIITESKEITTKKGGRMAFVRIEDETGGVEVTIFADLFKKISGVLSTDKPVILTGRVEKKDEGEVKLVAFEVSALEDAKANPGKIRARSTHITADAVALDAKTLTALKEMLRSAPGASPVIMHVMGPDREVVIGIDEALRITPGEGLFARIREAAGAEVKVA
ncbi:MAG: DNA polymerase III subunit alpha [Deltaproteobacteria bacterium]|nr:DNA polymerase III subunit alpha [Deltaproteobacteria bacterium]